MSLPVLQQLLKVGPQGVPVGVTRNTGFYSGNLGGARSGILGLVPQKVRGAGWGEKKVGLLFMGRTRICHTLRKHWSGT